MRRRGRGQPSRRRGARASDPDLGERAHHAEGRVEELLRLLAADHGNVPQKALEIVKGMVEGKKVFAFVGAKGGPLSPRIVQLAMERLRGALGLPAVKPRT